MVWFKFLLCVLIILLAGTKLARYADAIAEKTGLGRIWIGLVLLALITTMPELVTGVSSVALVKNTDLALGTLLGSCVFNLSIIGILDILSHSQPVLSQASLRHIASAGVGILLVAVIGGSILAGNGFAGIALGWISIPSIIIVIVYLVAMRLIFRFERSQPPLSADGSKYEGDSAKAVWLKFTLAAVAVVGAGIWLSLVGDEIAATYQLGNTFVGSLFLAIATSMPELVVAITALRLGAVDMAVADILGANMLDLANTFTIDLFYGKGSILASVSSAHLITILLTIMMTILIIVGLRFRQKRKTFFIISWYGLALIGLYLIGAYALFISEIG